MKRQSAAITAKDMPAVTVTDAQSPSIPSVKFTAFTVAYITTIAKIAKIKGLPKGTLPAKGTYMYWSPERHIVMTYAMIKNSCAKVF